MRVLHRGTDILVAEQLLDGANVVAVFEQMDGKDTSQGMTHYLKLRVRRVARI
jgi:hypothetical protein